MEQPDPEYYLLYTFDPPVYVQIQRHDDGTVTYLNMREGRPSKTPLTFTAEYAQEFFRRTRMKRIEEADWLAARLAG